MVVLVLLVSLAVVLLVSLTLDTTATAALGVLAAELLKAAHPLRAPTTATVVRIDVKLFRSCWRRGVGVCAIGVLHLLLVGSITSDDISIGERGVARV